MNNKAGIHGWSVITLFSSVSDPCNRYYDAYYR